MCQQNRKIERWAITCGAVVFYERANGTSNASDECSVLNVKAIAVLQGVNMPSRFGLPELVDGFDAVFGYFVCPVGLPIFDECVESVKSFSEIVGNEVVSRAVDFKAIKREGQASSIGKKGGFCMFFNGGFVDDDANVFGIEQGIEMATWHMGFGVDGVE